MSKNDFIIPDLFRDKILRIFREDGEAWLKKLPDLLEEFIQKWQLTDCQIEENLSVHYICYAYSPKYGEVVLKTGVPHLELYSGMDALHQYAGNHACMLYEMDREKGVMLLERILPGIRLRDEPDLKQRFKVGAELVRKISITIHGQHDFPLFQKQMDKVFTGWIR